MARFPNPLIDSIFKKIFGKEGQSEEFLIDFLNQIFIDDPELGNISSVRYGNTERIEDTPANKKIIFDIFCETSTGHKFIVEMQKANQRNFSNRMLYYMSRLVTDQVSRIKKEVKDSNYSLRRNEFDYMPVVGVFVCDFKTTGLPAKTLVREVICDEETGMVLTKTMRMAVVQLPYFDKTAEECKNGFDYWIYILRNMENLNALPFAEYKDRLFERLEKMAEYTNMTAEEQAQYDADVKFAMDYNETMLYKYDQGLAEGMEKGFAEGETRGREEGRVEEKWGIARLLFESGDSLEKISKVTGLSIDQLQQRLK